jgi:hypothetical protein
MGFRRSLVRIQSPRHNFLRKPIVELGGGLFSFDAQRFRHVSPGSIKSRLEQSLFRESLQSLIRVEFSEFKRSMMTHEIE